MSQKNILISGVNRGIGKELLLEVLEKGHFGVGLVRNEESKNRLEHELNEKGYDSYTGISEQKMVRSKNYNIRTQSCSRRNQQSRCSAIHWELYCCTLCLASRL